MSSEWERGFSAGYKAALKGEHVFTATQARAPEQTSPKKRKKLSAYNRFVKDCATKPRFKYKTGPNRGKLNMRAIGQAWRKRRKKV